MRRIMMTISRFQLILPVLMPPVIVGAQAQTPLAQSVPRCCAQHRGKDLALPLEPNRHLSFPFS